MEAAPQVGVRAQADADPTRRAAVAVYPVRTCAVRLLQPEHVSVLVDIHALGGRM